jgi:hypothetical protein
MSTYEILSIAVAFLSASFVGGTILVLAKELKLTATVHADNHEWNRRIETQRAIGEIRNLDIQKLNDTFGYKYRKEPIELEEITKAFESDWYLESQCVRLLNAHESLASGVKLGIYDEDVIVVNHKGNMERTFVRFKKYIDHIRHHTKKTTFMECQILIEKWESGEKNAGFKAPVAKNITKKST